LFSYHNSFGGEKCFEKEIIEKYIFNLFSLKKIKKDKVVAF